MTVLNKNEFLSLSDEDKWSKYRNLNITLIKHKKSSYVIKEKQYVMLRGLQKIIRVIDMLFDHPYNSTGELYSKKRNANAKLIQDLKSSIRYSVYVTSVCERGKNEETKMYYYNIIRG